MPRDYTKEEVAAFDAAYVPANARRDMAFTSGVVSQLVPGGELDAERQKFIGQRRVAGTVALGLSGVERAIKTGDPQLLEALDFGAGSDGVPFVHFIDTKGESQYVNVSTREWNSMLVQRSQAREELTFRRNASADRDALSSQWNTMITQSDIPDSDKEMYGLMWQVSPKSALTALHKDNAQRTVAEQKAKLLGDTQAQFDDAFSWVNSELQSRGITQLPPSTSSKQITSVMDMLLKDRFADNPMRTYRGQEVPDSIATTGVVRDLGRVENNRRFYNNVKKSVLDQETLQPKPGEFFLNAPRSVDVVASNDRLPSQAAEPDMSIHQNWMNQGRTANDLRDVLGHYVVTAALMNEQYRPPDMGTYRKRNKDTGAEYYEIDDAAMAHLEPTFNALEQIFHMQGWKRLSEEDRRSLAGPLIGGIDGMKKYTEHIQPISVMREPTSAEIAAGLGPQQGQQPGQPQGQPQGQQKDEVSRMESITAILNSPEGQQRTFDVNQHIIKNEPTARAWIHEKYYEVQKNPTPVGAISALIFAVQNGDVAVSENTRGLLEEFRNWLSQKVSPPSGSGVGGFTKTLSPRPGGPRRRSTDARGDPIDFPDENQGSGK